MKIRNYGLDVARILAILGIIILHINGVGGLISTSTSISFWVIEWVEILAYCSVDLFAMLSGYLGIQSTKRSSYRAIELLSISIIYSAILSVIFWIAFPNQMNISNLINGLFPILEGRYWYLYCYIPLRLLQPYINKLIWNLTIRQHKNVLILLIVCSSVIPSLIHWDTLGLKEGYSFAWLFICYFIGAYIKRTEELYKMHYVGRWIFLYFLLSFVLLLGNCFLCIVYGTCVNYFVSYTSPIVLMMGISLLVGLKNLKKTNREYRILTLLSNLAFDVYLLHCHILVYNIILDGSFAWISMLNPLVIPIVILGSAIFIGFICLIPAYVRRIIYKKISFKRVSHYLDKIIYED